MKLIVEKVKQGFIMNKTLKFLFLLLFLSISFISFSEEENYKKRAFYRSQIVDTFVREMENEFGLLCIGEGGSMPYDIQEISLRFKAYQKATVEEARELLVMVTERFIQIVNAHQKIAPYLREYPATPAIADIAISFCKNNHYPYMDGSVAHALTVNNKIFYKKQDPDSQKYKLKALYEEPYEKALEIVQDGRQICERESSYQCEL